MNGTFQDEDSSEKDLQEVFDAIVTETNWLKEIAPVKIIGIAEPDGEKAFYLNVALEAYTERPKSRVDK